MSRKHSPRTPHTCSWISVEKSLPDSDTTVLITTIDNSEPVWLGYHNGDCWRSVDGSQVSVSHWAEMPEPAVSAS